MQVADLARATGASARSIRHYERAGLVRSTRRPNGYRDFGHEAIDEVTRIQSLIRVGLNLREIAELTTCFTRSGELDGCDAARRTLSRHLDELTHRIADLQRTQRLLQGVQDRMTLRLS